MSRARLPRISIWHGVLALLAITFMCTAFWRWKAQAENAQVERFSIEAFVDTIPVGRGLVAGTVQGGKTPDDDAAQGGVPAARSPEKTDMSNPKARRSALAVGRPGVRAGTVCAAEVNLCAWLTMPKGTRLACVVPDHCRRKRQELTFHITTPKWAPLLLVRVSECTEGQAVVGLETLQAKEQLAFLSTQELWLGSARPKLAITWPNGDAYGFIQAEPNGDYALRRGDDTPLWTLSGNFPGHRFQVKDAQGHAIGSTQPAEEGYQILIEAQVDVCLVILTLLAIDKCEGQAAAD